MKRFSILLTAGLTIALAGCGASRASSRASSRDEIPLEYQEEVPPGTRLVLRLGAELSSSAPIGATVRARTAQEVRGVSGELLVPRDAVVTARVVDRAAEAIWVRMETLEMGGRIQPLRGAVIAAQLPGKGDAPGTPATAPTPADRGLRGELPGGTLLEVELSRPLTSFSAIRSRYE